MSLISSKGNVIKLTCILSAAIMIAGLAGCNSGGGSGAGPQ